MEGFLGLIVGVLASLGVITYLKSLKRKELVNAQSVVLLEKIKTVCKFITVEGDFAEIYHYENVKELFLKLVASRKKALVVINAKAHIGYDLSKIRLKADTERKQVILEDFPQPEVLSIETNLNYYDKKEGYFNRFAAQDLTGLQAEAKAHIKAKIPESGLLQLAQKEALESILLIETIVQTIGWKLDYSALKIDEESIKEVKEK
ncbi:DUF4230 domain-containing protein [Changchengzhania lutea]|uniref:DUF4230 domain-containing protein n=1 Tax=Changchengzhania lutea TaxID=2049305 RepID=UPI00115DC1A9|nr:DUF4230 domain-containing protein [Changchengzhania lutea]